MANRSWNNHSQDWDPMRDDYNDSNFEAQYPDENTGGGVQLDQCRLYITNIPRNLTCEGLKTVFQKYGTLVETFLSKDQQKRYGLISYETPGEAKLAMMKLNRMEPLNLNINIAHKTRTERQSRDTRDMRERNYGRLARETSSRTTSETGYNHRPRETSPSVSSKGRSSWNQEDTVHGDGDLEDLVEDDLSLADNMDPDLHMELVQLKMEHLKLQEAQLQCKQRMLLLNRAGKKPTSQSGINRCILPDGTIVVRNINDRAADVQDNETATGGGDLLKLPALQRVGSRACVSCGAPADAYCARCGVTPYCSPRCQRRDWAERHRAVCHNLARLTNGDGKESNSSPPPAPEAFVVDSVIPPTAPLRRPHTPANQNLQRKNDNKTEDNVDDIQQQKRFFPHGPNARAGQQNNNRGRLGFNNANNRHQDNRQDNRAHANRQANRQYDRQDHRAQNRAAPARKPMRQESETVEDEWNIGSKTQSAETNGHAPKPTLGSPVKQIPVEPAAPAPDVKPVVTSGEETKEVLKPATVDDVTPARKIVPKKCLIELLSVGDMVMLSVDNRSSECRSKPSGFVCLSLHEKYESEYQTLCDEYAAECEADSATYTATPGEPFSYLNPEDSAWYRARCLNPTLAALIDCSKVVTLTPKDNIKKLSEKYGAIPEFCCYLDSDKVQVGDNLKCTLISETMEGYKVLIENAETGASIGDGEVSRWLPEVEYPVSVPTPVGGAGAIAEVPRPEVRHNSRVLLAEATEPRRACVRGSDAASQRRYDCVLHGVALYGQDATPLKQPPQKGQLVVGKFSDGLHYRALCKRTNVRQNKYLLEYIEYGNLEIATLENIYPCPAEFDLSAHPAEASLVSLRSEACVLTPPAIEYIEKLKNSAAELVLTLCDGVPSAPSGAEVKLTVADTKESVNGKLEELCTPDWKKLERSGVDVVETTTLMYCDLEYTDLPVNGCEIEVLDISALQHGNISGCVKGDPLTKKILEDLPKQMEAYCNSELGREPYLPKFEELCIAQCPPYPQWFRAVLCEQVSGAGGELARVCYVDYGNMELVSVRVLRKMLPEFMRGLPALAQQLELSDFPKEPSQEMLARAVKYMKINDEGRGYLKVSRCKKVDRGMYVVDVPELIAAING